MKKIMILAFLLITITLTLSAQDSSGGRWGIHFQIYTEPHEADNPIYVNVLPLVYEHCLNAYTTLKAGAVCGLRLADGVSLGNLGISLGIPVYPLGYADSPDGFFVGPLVIASRNFHTGESVLSTAADAGYAFSIGGTMGLTLGVELGVSTFFSEEGTAMRPHYGPAVYLYF
jgi:hypothetical protein